MPDAKSGFCPAPESIIRMLLYCQGPVLIVAQCFSFLHDVTEQNKMVRLHGDGAITYGQQNILFAKIFCLQDSRPLGRYVIRYIISWGDPSWEVMS
jgi:hypothetical protein